MMHWIQENGGHPLLIRAVADPREDFDVIPEFWQVGEERWIADESLGSDLAWDPNVHVASATEIAAITGNHAA